MILCCGEALIDMLPVTAADGRAAYAPHAGGAVFNTAIALGRLGAPAGFFSGVSNDQFGGLLADELAASQVDASLLARSDRLTTLAVVHLKDGQATYTFYDENSAGRMLSVDDLPPGPVNATAMFFGGISLPQEPCGDAYAALLAREADDKVIMVDPNIRPAFIADERRYRDRLTGMLARADIVKASDEDLAWLFGEGEESGVAKLLELGPKLVLVTRGGDGASGYHQDGWCAKTSSLPVRVVDTVGAGDTFNAGVLAQLYADGCLTKLALAEIGEAMLTRALAKGAEAAAVTVSRAGANPPWAHELDAG